MIRINVSKAYQSVSNRIKGVSNLIVADVHPAIMRRGDDLHSMIRPFDYQIQILRGRFTPRGFLLKAVL